MQYLRFKPNRLWQLDTTSPFADKSGYRTNATLIGSEVKGIPLSTHAAYSHVVGNGNYIRFPQNVYLVGKENQEFSIAASVFLPDTGSVSVQQICSNLEQADGLSISNSNVTFGTIYTSSGTALCSYTIPTGRKIDAVGVHTPAKNYLFVNGELVDEIDITQDQQNDTYLSTDGYFYSGDLSSRPLLINTVAIFPRALGVDEIGIIYSDNNNPPSEPYIAYGGELIDISSNTRKPFVNSIYSEESDWESGTMASVFVDEDGVLRPEMSGTLTQSGTWQDTINLYNGDTADTIDSVNLYWYGTNVLVEATVDGTNWETVSRGINLTSIPTGFDPTGAALTLRVTFTASQDEAHIDNLQVRGYLSNTAQQPNGRVITYTAPTATFDDQIPSLLMDDWGTKIQGGSLEIGSDTTSGLPMTVKTVEIWVKQLGPAAPTFSTSLTSGSTVYTNGVAGSTMRQGEWSIRHYVKSGGFTDDFVFSGQVQIGRVVVYDNALTSGQIATVVANYFGPITIGVGDGGLIDMSEPTESANISGHDWSTLF